MAAETAEVAPARAVEAAMEAAVAPAEAAAPAVVRAKAVARAKGSEVAGMAAAAKVVAMVGARVTEARAVGSYPMQARVTACEMRW